MRIFDFHTAGTEVLGDGHTVGQDTGTNRAILIKVNNPDELARSQGGAAALAQMIAPSTVATKVIDTVADKIRSALKDQHVDASVTIVEPSAFVPADGKHVWQDVGLAIGGAGVIAVLFTMLWGRR